MPDQNSTAQRCSFCRALRESPWWYRLWLRVAYGIKAEHS